MTLHGAKGLQERTVVISGLATEMIPGRAKSDTAENARHENEQRRLLYVAVTRAQDELILSWSDRIASGDTLHNGVVQHPNGVTLNGIYQTRLTRSRLLPPRPHAPERGQTWAAHEVLNARND